MATSSAKCAAPAVSKPVAGLTSVVVVSHRSATTLGRCLDAALSQSAAVEVIVVDNGSDDGTVELVQARLAREPCLHLLANEANRGFAAACNQGAAQARGDALLLLNPDAFLGADAVARLRRHLDADPALGLLGCAVLDESGRPHGPQRRREPTPARSLASLLRLDRWAGREGIEATTDAKAAGHPEPVDAVNGSVMLVDLGLYLRLGGMDERFLLHAEDLDLCRRVREAGRAVARAGDVAVVHLGGVSGRRRPLWVEWQKTRSLWRYYRKHYPAAGAAQCISVAAGLSVRLLARLPFLLLRRRH
ncbi:MAG: glycosyltransferase family 2 protein [Xanthomonadales bacterium]|nr:glycosyltransferase family 2 protein [Xanthomonadales bacterium]